MSVLLYCCCAGGGCASGWMAACTRQSRKRLGKRWESLAWYAPETTDSGVASRARSPSGFSSSPPIVARDGVKASWGKLKQFFNLIWAAPTKPEA
ncbi:hypothetical protein GUJ93_ZPchr0001g31673 [Zizania palustris]|uniref:Secreted protein n=1 Tax=Zizania palustris TaxID=103762 RepID=A0A8J5RWQ3_ZIZPA|nr:hypothetical protein GUJ93_ZPchr0001g31673 [Zizania palustris]